MDLNRFIESSDSDLPAYKRISAGIERAIAATPPARIEEGVALLSAAMNGAATGSATPRLASPGSRR